MCRSRLDAARRLSVSLVALAALALPATASAQSTAPPRTDYQPTVGQEGKDVIWVPTPQALVERMLDMARITSSDMVIDLGSGDGRTVITAARKFGARALGIEYNPDMVELAKRNAAKEGVSGRAQFVHGDIFQVDFSHATVLTLYLLPSLNVKLRPTILKMAPGTRVVSHAFTMEEWKPDQTDTVEGRSAYLWIVPANIEGIWRWNVAGSGPRDYELTLRQQYQQVEGLVRLDGKSAQLRNVKLRGEQITFSVNELAGPGSIRRDFVGRVNGDTIEGVMKLPNDAGEVKWTATRAKPPAPAEGGTAR